MTISVNWMQNNSHSARQDRQIIDALYSEGVIDKTGGDFAVTQRGAGANFSVDVAAGRAIVQGDDQSDQGSYLVESTATENVVVGAAPGSNSRIDLVILQVNDPNAGGAAGDNATLAIVAGTAAASPAVPATPDSAIVLAQLLVTSATVSIQTANITDRRTQVTSPITPMRTMLGGFVLSGAGGSLQPSVTNEQLQRGTSASGAVSNLTVNATPILAMRDGSVTGVGIALANARTGGTATFQAWINGVATGLTAVIDGTNTQYKVTTQAAGLDTFVAGDRLDIRATTTAAWATTGGEQGEAFIEVTYT